MAKIISSLLLFLSFGLLSFIPLYKIYYQDSHTPPQTPEIYYLAYIIFLGLIFTYIFFLRSWYLTKFRKKHLIWLAVLFLAIIAINISLPVLDSYDVAQYQFLAREVYHYHQSPYLVTVNDFINSNDPLFEQTIVEWRDSHCHYGPLWLIISLLPGWLAGTSIKLGFLFFRLVNFIGLVLAGWLVYQLAKKTKKQSAIFWLMVFLFNPFILFHGINNGHNDLWIIVLFLLLLYCYQQRKYFWVWPVFILMVLVKSVLIIIAPLLLVWLVIKIRHKQLTVLSLLMSLIASSLIIVALFAPFWQGMETLVFLQELGSRYYNIYLAPILKVMEWFLNVSGLVTTASALQLLVRLFAVMIMMGLLLILLIQRWRSKQWNFSGLSHDLFILLLGFLAAGTVWLQAWYLLWLFPALLFLADDKAIDFFILISLIGFYSGYLFDFFLCSIVFICLYLSLRLIVCLIAQWPPEFSKQNLTLYQFKKRND